MPDSSTIVLRTERLVLRYLHEDDAPFILAHLNQPSFIENIRDSGVRTLEQAVLYLRNGAMASYEKHGFGLYLVEIPGDESSAPIPIGMCGLLKRDNLAYPDLGFALDPPYWGQGFAREAAAAVLAYGHGQLNLTRILAVTSPDNEPSARLLLRLGMTDEGTQDHDDMPARIFSHHHASAG